MGNQPRVLTTVGLLLMLFLVPASHAHEQKTLTVIMNENGVVSGNITDPSFVQGNAVWFQMHDDTENTTMIVRLDVNLDGVFNASDDFESSELVNECELDENGSLMDETCAVSALYAFESNATVDTYTIWILHVQNGTQTMWYHSIVVHEDVHEEDGPSPGDCFGIGCIDENTVDGETDDIDNEQSMMVLLLLVSAIGIVALALSIQKERSESDSLKVYPEEE